MKTSGFLRFAVLLLAVLFFQSFSVAQNNSSDATLSGILMDSSGGAIEGVVVSAVVEGPAGAAVVTVNSKADGSYSLSVPAGRYRVRFARSSFISVEHVV